MLRASSRLRILSRTLSSMAAHPTVIDGSTLEGGGQILRNTTALAALLGKPVTINNVRAGRPQPGLKAQHAAGLKLVAEVCDAAAEGIEKGSSTVSFQPGPIRAGTYSADPGTAGSTTLLLQISLPCLLYAHEVEPSENVDTAAQNDSPEPVLSTLTLRGGTNASNAPPVDYTQHVFLPFLHRHFLLQNNHLTLDIKKRGFFPYGGGELRVQVPALAKGQTLPPVTLTERGRITEINGLAYTSGSLPRRIATELQQAAASVLTRHLSESWAQDHVRDSESDLADPSALSSSAPILPPIKIDLLLDPSGKAGSGIILWAKTSTGCILGTSALGSKGTNAQKTGRAAAAELVANLKHGGCVDEYMQDQMIIFLALAKGKSSVKTGPLSLHTKTAIWVAEQLTEARFEVITTDTERNQVLITCEGIGLEGRH